MAKSRMNTEKGTCYICGRVGYTEKHHIFEGTANRKISEQEGLWCYLCYDCHHNVIHRYPKCDRAVWLKQRAQKTWEDDFKKDYPYKRHADMAAREEFIRLFGRSYL